MSAFWKKKVQVSCRSLKYVFVKLGPNIGNSVLSYSTNILFQFLVTWIKLPCMIYGTYWHKTIVLKTVVFELLSSPNSKTKQETSRLLSLPSPLFFGHVCYSEIFIYLWNFIVYPLPHPKRKLLFVFEWTSHWIP